MRDRHLRDMVYVGGFVADSPLHGDMAESSPGLRPGSRLPPVSVLRLSDNASIPTWQLLDCKRWTLLALCGAQATDEDVEHLLSLLYAIVPPSAINRWILGQRRIDPRLAALNIPQAVDPRGSFFQSAGATGALAILVRPDGYIATTLEASAEDDFLHYLYRWSVLPRLNLGQAV